MSCWAVWAVNVKRKWKVTGYRGNIDVAVGVKDNIYFFSELYESAFGPFDVKIFHTETYQWSFLRNENVSLNNEILPLEIRWRTAVAYKDLVYLFAGINKESRDVLFCYDTSSNLWTKPNVTGIMPPAAPDFSRVSTCVIDDAIYVYGRSGRNLSLYAQKVFKLDLKTFKWSLITTTGQPPMNRVGHSTTAIKNSMFIYGGHGNEGTFNDDVISLDTQTMKWVTHEVSGYRPVGRYHHSAVCYKGSLLVFGGVNSDYEEAYNDLVRFDPDSHSWSQVETKGNGPCSRFDHSCVLIQDRVFVFGGFQCPSLDACYPDHINNIHTCDFAPSLKTMSIVAVLEHKLDQRGLPETIRRDIKLTNPEEFQSGNNDE